MRMEGGQMPVNIKSTRSGNAIPENELWLHRPSAADKLSRAIKWAEKHPPKASNLDAIERKQSKHLWS
jgi:hypothetical protein